MSRYEVQYKLQRNDHNHSVTVSAHKDQFKDLSFGQFRVDVTITDYAKMENVYLFFITSSRFSSRTLCEARPKDLDFIKRWILIQEEIRDYSDHHNYHPDTVVACIRAFLDHLDTEINKEIAKKLTGDAA